MSHSSGADLQLRGNGCVAADFDGDGYTDLYVTTAGYNVPTDTYDALLWNDGDGTFTEGAQAAGIDAPGWHAGATVGDVNGDGRPDLFVASYTDPNALVQSPAGFPTNHLAVRDLLYLNEGTDSEGRSTFRDVAQAVGIERSQVGHGLGAVFTDYDGDGRLDVYVANDADPNQLYRNVPGGGGLGFRFEEVARREDAADPNAGMGIAAADFNRDGKTDLFVTNSRGQLHAAYRSLDSSGARPSFADARPAFAAAVGTNSTGWGASWADLDLDGDLDLALANGAIPVTNVAKDAQRVQVIENVSRAGGADRFASVGQRVGLEKVPRVNGRGLAAADYDNDGDLDVAINTIGGRLILLENRAPSRHWLEVRLADFAPGAVVTVTLPDGRELVREVHAGSSYLSSEDPRVHFGLGGARRVATLEVRLPDGRVLRRTNVAANRIVDLDRLAARALLQPAGDGVERDGREQDDAGHDVDRPRRVTTDIQAVRDRRDDERAEQGAAHLAPAPEQAHAADDRGRDRVEQERAASDVQVHGLETRREDDPADAGHDPGDHEHENPHARDVDAGAPRRLGVAADRVDVAPEGRALCQERQAHEEHEHENRGERQSERLRAVHRQRRALGTRRRPRRVCADADHPEGEDPDTDDLHDRRQRTDLRPARF